MNIHMNELYSVAFMTLLCLNSQEHMPSSNKSLVLELNQILITYYSIVPLNTLFNFVFTSLECMLFR